MPVPTKPQPARPPAPPTSSEPPRRNPLAMAPAPIDGELQAQLNTRADRRRAAAKAKRPKATYDLAPHVQALVDAVADAENVSRSDVVALAILRLHADVAAGRVDLGPMKRAARSLKFAWKLELPGGTPK